jgi:hypothetical protein
MSSVANVSVAAVAPAAAARGASGLKQASPTNVRFNSGKYGLFSGNWRFGFSCVTFIGHGVCMSAGWRRS